MQHTISRSSARTSSDRADGNDDSPYNGLTSQLSRTKSKNRDPPPALFMHPSPAASHVSIPGVSHPSTSAPAVPPLPQQPQSHQRNASLTVSGPTPLLGRPVANLRSRESARSADKTDALWAEMQATLEEVELSASGGTHVFGPDHDRKLSELRAAQIALAQAWARSEADDAIGMAHHDDAVMGALRGPGASSNPDETKNPKGATADGTDGSGTSAGRPGSSGGGIDTEGLGAKLEKETEADILLARKRREANDRYFQKVNQGVVDVVARLDEVAVAMRAVEQESKDIWGEGDAESPPASSKA